MTLTMQGLFLSVNKRKMIFAITIIFFVWLCCRIDPKPKKMLLSGYSVELAIKSTEYKAVDDTRVKGQTVTYQ